MPSKKYTPGGYEHIAVSMKKMFKQLNINVRYDSLENLGHNILSVNIKIIEDYDILWIDYFHK